MHHPAQAAQHAARQKCSMQLHALCKPSLQTGSASCRHLSPTHLHVRLLHASMPRPAARQEEQSRAKLWRRAQKCRQGARCLPRLCMREGGGKGGREEGREGEGLFSQCSPGAAEVFPFLPNALAAAAHPVTHRWRCSGLRRSQTHGAAQRLGVQRRRPAGVPVRVSGAHTRATVSRGRG